MGIGDWGFGIEDWGLGTGEPRCHFRQSQQRVHGHDLSGVRVQRVQRVQKVQKVQRVMVSPPLAAMSMKSALRECLPVSYSMINILLIGSLRSPPPFPASRDFSTGKRLTWFSGRYCSPTNQVRLPPLCRGQNKPLYAYPWYHVAQC